MTVSVNVVAFPSDDLDFFSTSPPSPKRKAYFNMDDRSPLREPPAPKRKRLTRSVSFRSLAGLLADENLAPVPSGNEHDFLSSKDQVLRSVTGPVAEDGHVYDADDEEFYALFTQSCLRPVESGDDQSLADEKADTASAHVTKSKSGIVLRPMLSAELNASRSSLTRFNVDILPYNRRTVMWDALET